MTRVSKSTGPRAQLAALASEFGELVADAEARDEQVVVVPLQVARRVRGALFLIEGGVDAMTSALRSLLGGR